MALEEVITYAKNNFMKINPTKSKIMLFNPKRRKVDFYPNITLNGDRLEVKTQMRLVGLILSDDLMWKANTDSLIEGLMQSYG